MSDYSTNASVNCTINGQQALETLENLKKSALRLTDEIARAAAAGDKVTLKKLRKEFNDTKRQIKEMESATMQVNAVLQRLGKSTPQELQKTLVTLNKQLNFMERGTKEWEEQVSKIKLVKGEIAKVNGELARSQTFLERFNSKFNEWQGTFMMAAGAITGVVVAGKKAVQMYAEMQQEEANVRKYTGMTAEEVEHLNEAFKKMDTRSSRDELNRLAQEAGRLGKTTEEDVLGFVRAADVINVALDELGDGATLQLSKLTSIFGDEARLGTEKSMLAVGSVINELSQNCTAGAGYLAQFGQRLAGVGAQANMTVPQIMAFGAVLDSQGQKVEMSATALSKLIMNLFKNTDKIAKATGMDLEEFSATVQRSTNEGLLMLLERLNELGDMSVLAPVFADMGENGARASAVISALAGNIDMVKWEQQEAEKAFMEGTSVLKEYEVQNTTVQAGLDKARKGFQEMAIELGKELMPILRHIISTTSATMRLMLKTIQFVKEHRVAIISTAAAIGAYTIAVNLATIRTKAHNAMVVIATTVQKLWNKAIMMNPLGLLAAAAAAAVTAIVMLTHREKEHIQAVKHETELDKKLHAVEEQVKNDYQQEAGQIRALSAVLVDSNRSIEERKTALEKLKSIVPDYHASLTEEGKLINNNREALDEYLISLKNSIRAKANEEKLNVIATEQVALEDKMNTAPMQKMKKEYEEYQGVIEGIQQQIMRTEDATEKKRLEEQLWAIKRTRNATTQAYQNCVDEMASLQKKADKILADTGVPVVSKVTGGDTPTPDADDGKPSKNKFQAEDDWKEKEEALNRIAYARGEVDYEAYTKKMLQIQVDYNKKKLEHTDLEGNEEVTIQASYYEALKKQKDNAISGTVEQEERAYKDVLAILQQRYMDGELSARQYQSAMELAELEHLRKIAGLYDEGSKERIKAEERYHSTSLKQQQKHLEESKRLQEQFRTQFFTKAYQTPDTESYNRDLQNLELVHAQMLKACGTNNRDKLKVEKAFQEAKYQLGRKYNVKNAKELKKSYRSAIDDIADWLESDGGEALTGSLETILSGMSEIFSGISDLIQAELDVETAKIETSYDAQISAAEGNKYKEVQLENQKQKEIAKAKKEANKKMFAMQVIQAVAQTAMSAISAYSSAAAIPVVGFVMAPIAAAMAIAAGALQIASIKKQQQASEATGYMRGGFTPAGPVDKEVGVVHAGEWVASQRLLANPEARALVNTLDYAQRTNSMSSLKATDVSRSITAPQVVAQTATNGKLDAALAATAAALSDYSNTMKGIGTRLNEPFVTVNTVEGDSGIKKAQDEYNQLMKNKTPKSQRK